MKDPGVAMLFNPWLLAGGLALMLSGFGLYHFFNPSPHGYLETFVAQPVFCVGLALTGLSLLVRPGRLGRVRVAAGGALVLLAASPVLALAWWFLG